MADERSDAGSVQPFETPHKLDLCGNTAIGPVKDVACHEQRIDTAIDTERNHTFVGMERGAPEDVSDLRLRLPDPRAGTVQVQIGRMNKAKRHDSSIRSHPPRTAVVLRVT